MKKHRILLVTALILGLFLAGASHADEEITSKDQLNHSGIIVGVGTGSAAMLIAEGELPEAEIRYFESQPTAYEAVAQGKIHAYIADRKQMELAIRDGMEGVHLLNENMDETVRIAVGISPLCSIPDFENKLNTFIAEMKADGVLDDMYNRWVEEKNETMPDIAIPDNPQYHLTVGTSGVAPPYTFYSGTDLSGFDIELARRFALWIGADLEFRTNDYAGLIADAVTGNVDCIMANLNVTPEREEALPFSDPLYEEQVGIMVRGGRKSAYTSLSQLSESRIGIPSGTSFDLMIQRAMPNAKRYYYNNQTDLMEALASGKIDAFPSDEPVIRYIMNMRSDITYIPEYLETYDAAYCFAKTPEGEKLCREFSEFLKKMKEDGRLDATADKWFSTDESRKTLPDYQSFPAPNGMLVMATDGDYMPFEYFRDGETVGYDVDLAAQFCEAYGYGLKIAVMNLDAVVPAVESGKSDFGGSALSITPERAESVLFSEPNYSGGTVLVVRNTASSAGGTSGSGGILESFEKTFIRENRWKLFLEGVENTLIITLLTILLGTALGFGIYMPCRNGSRLANGITRFCLWLVHGTPTVVLLMILYYIVFRSVSISGLMVAVIGFSLTFGSAVFGLLRVGVGAVDKGQYEAAYALGYTNLRTFFRIILPQALPHVAASYRDEIVSLIKATSIVGYIAVQDLTKMGDIVRSRTFEAFFPLIAVTVIYFVLEGLIGFLISRIGTGLNTKNRKPASILKGVKTDDPG